MAHKKSRIRELQPRKSMTKEEEEAGIMEMYHAGHTYPEIAKEYHKSITTLKEIIDRHESSLLPKEKTKASEAYRLFKEGKDCLEVAIELGLGASETKKYFEEYIELSGVDEFKQIYSEVGSNIQVILSFHKTLKDKAISIEQIPSLQQLASKVNSLHEQHNSLTFQCDRMNKSLSELSPELIKLQNKNDKLKLEESNLLTRIQELFREKSTLDSVLNSMKHLDMDYKKIEEIANGVAKSIMISRMEAIATALAATILTLKADNNMAATLFLWPSTANQYIQLVKSFGELVQCIWDQIEYNTKNKVRVAVYQRVTQIASGLRPSKP